MIRTILMELPDVRSSPAQTPGSSTAWGCRWSTTSPPTATSTRSLGTTQPPLKLQAQGDVSRTWAGLILAAVVAVLAVAALVAVVAAVAVVEVVAVEGGDHDATAFTSHGTKKSIVNLMKDLRLTLTLLPDKLLFQCYCQNLKETRSIFQSFLFGLIVYPRTNLTESHAWRLRADIDYCNDSD